jgi:hypothetical protein
MLIFAITMILLKIFIDALKEILYQSDKVIMGTEGVLPHMAVKPKASTNSQ